MLKEHAICGLVKPLGFKYANSWGEPFDFNLKERLQNDKETEKDSIDEAG